MHAGEVVAERFVIEREAGRGGMGTVYRALDRTTGEPVALKLLTSHEAVDAHRFEREARLLGAQEHPGIVRYVDHGATRKGEVYLAMEWLEGASLAELRGQHTLTIDDAVAIVRGAASALGAAHARGVVHRDVKPGNLFLVNHDPRRVKVLDFGIARGPGSRTLTVSGMVVGTPYFMAPEQARGETRVDPRADVYALGAVLYDLLTGRPPFANDNLMALLASILLDEPMHVQARRPSVPDALADLVMRLLAKEPERRPADGAALARELDAVGPLEPSRGGRSLAPAALTESEQRVLCLLVSPGKAIAPSDATLVGELAGEREGDASACARRSRRTAGAPIGSPTARSSRASAIEGRPPIRPPAPPGSRSPSARCYQTCRSR